MKYHCLFEHRRGCSASRSTVVNGCWTHKIIINKVCKHWKEYLPVLVILLLCYFIWIIHNLLCRYPYIRGTAPNQLLSRYILQNEQLSCDVFVCISNIVQINVKNMYQVYWQINVLLLIVISRFDSNFKALLLKYFFLIKQLKDMTLVLWLISWAKN